MAGRTDRLTVRESVPPEYVAIVLVAIGLAVLHYTSHSRIGWSVVGVGLIQLILVPGDAWIIDCVDRSLAWRHRRCFVISRYDRVDLQSAIVMEIEEGEYVYIDSDMGERPCKPKRGEIVLADGPRCRVIAPEKIAAFLGLAVSKVPTRTLAQKWREAKNIAAEEH